MYYRLQVGTVDGIECGYQWREIDIALFTSIGTGAKPEGDAEAQQAADEHVCDEGRLRTDLQHSEARLTTSSLLLAHYY